MDVIVEILFNKLYKLYLSELIDVNIGYIQNKDRMSLINDLINAIDLIQNGQLTTDEIIKIISYYE